MSSNELEGQDVVQFNQSRRFMELRIASNERTNGDPWNFLASFGNDVRLDHITAIELQAFTMPNIANNISLAIGNSQFAMFFTGAGFFSTTVPDGFYSTAQIISILETQINAFIAPSTINITQSPITGKLNFNITGIETFATLTADSFPASLMSPTLGILTQVGPTNDADADALPNLRGATVFFVHSLELGQNRTYLIAQGGDVDDVNGIFTIPINVDYGVMQTYRPVDPDRIVYGRLGVSARNFQVTIRVDGGRLYTELTDNQPFVMVFKLYWSKSMY